METVSDSRPVGDLFSARRPVRKPANMRVSDACSCSDQLYDSSVRLAERTVRRTSPTERRHVNFAHN